MKTKTLTPEQQAARDARKAKQKALFERLSKMNAVDRANLAAQMPVVTCDGHTLSVANMCLIALQSPAATVVGGFRQWMKHGRAVRKGEHGLTIRVPAGARKEAAEASGDATEGESVFFVAGTVFDVSQTEVMECEREASHELTTETAAA